jgi:hypothetical protein
MSWDIRGDIEDRRFWRKHVFFKSPGTLEWICDREASSPEDALIAAIDAKHDDGADEGELPPLPTLDGLPADLVWMWHCRETGTTWKEIAGMLGLRTPAGAWKRYHRLIAEARKKPRHSIGGS